MQPEGSLPCSQKPMKETVTDLNLERNSRQASQLYDTPHHYCVTGTPREW